MRQEYPKRFRLTGYVDLQYINYTEKYSSEGRNSTGQTSTFEQTYRLDLEGYVYHPRLAVFFSDITFDNQRVLGRSIKSRALSYSLNLVVLPYRPITLSIHASRSNTSTDVYSFSSDRIINNYGARLDIGLLHFPALRRIQVRYDHTDSTYDSLAFSNNSYSLALSGSLPRIRTSYGILLGASNFTFPTGDLNSRYLSVQTNSFLYRGIGLATGLRFYKDDNNKALGINASLDFPEGEKFSHYYDYRYEKDRIHFPGSVEGGIPERTIQNMNEVFEGTWSYRFTDRLSSTAALQYGIHEDEVGSWNSNAASVNLTYRRPIIGLSSTSQYRLTLRDNGERGNAMEHAASIELTTRRFRFGTIYFSYYFRTLNATDKIPEISAEELGFGAANQEFVESRIKSTSHVFVLGARGRGIGRRLPALLWDIEANYSYSTGSVKRPQPLFDYDYFDFFGSQNIEFERRDIQYSILGRINYRFGRSSTFTSQAQYFIGKTDSLTRKSLILQQQINYVMRKNLTFLARWRERRYQIEGYPNASSRDLEFEARYRIGKTFLILNYLVLMNEREVSHSQLRRLTLRLRRYL